MNHPRMELNSAFNNPLRFSLMAALAGVHSVQFKQLREHLSTTDSTLSKHGSALEELGYVKINKHFVGKKPATAYQLTKAGRAAWASHLDALQKIAFDQ